MANETAIFGYLSAKRPLKNGLCRLSIDVEPHLVGDVKCPESDVALIFDVPTDNAAILAERARCVAILRAYLRWDHQTPAFSWHSFQNCIEAIMCGQVVKPA